MSETAAKEFFVRETGHPLPCRSLLVKVLTELKAGESFTVPNAHERMRAIGLARTRKIKIVSKRCDDKQGFRIWRA